MKRESEHKKIFFPYHNTWGCWNLLAIIIVSAPESKGFFICVQVSCMLQCASQRKDYLDFYCIHWLQWESKQYQHYLFYAGIWYFGLCYHVCYCSLHCVSDWMCVIRKKRKRITKALSKALYSTQTLVRIAGEMVFTHILNCIFLNSFLFCICSLYPLNLIV